MFQLLRRIAAAPLDPGFRFQFMSQVTEDAIVSLRLSVVAHCKAFLTAAFSHQNRLTTDACL